MTKEAIILAGGLGTRLRGILPDIPKCMAPVAGQPFLAHVIRYLLSQGIEHFIFSLGYKHRMIEEFIRLRFPALQYELVVEDAPLQTGGAIRAAMQRVKGEQAFVINGDTLFRVDLPAMHDFHVGHQAECTLALKPLTQFDRFGMVVTNEEGRILHFEEKKQAFQGNINGGIYLISRTPFLSGSWPDVFSFEKEYLERYTAQKRFFGFLQQGYFIDIGVPEDFQRAQYELKQSPLPYDQVDHTWTLFLDRDGVINHDPGDYVYRLEEFQFLDGAPQAIAHLGKIFGRVIIITNQRAVGKGLMTEAELNRIHTYLAEEVKKAGGHLDAIFACTSVQDDHPDRKPNPGMAHQARQQFPEIDFRRSIMVGDKKLDMEWARNIGAYAVWKRSLIYPIDPHDMDVDGQCDSLADFVDQLERG